MDLSIEGAVIEVATGEALRLAGADGRRITVVRGAVWITYDGDRRDIVLESGADLVLNYRGGAILQALGGSALVALEDGIKIGRPELQPVAEWHPGSETDRAARRARAEAVAALLASLGAAVRRLWARLEKRFEAARTRHELHALSDYSLRDIGLRRSEIDCLTRG